MLAMLNVAVRAQVPLVKLRTMMYGFSAFYSGLGEGLGDYNASGMISVMDPEYKGLKALNRVG